MVELKMTDEQCAIIFDAIRSISLAAEELRASHTSFNDSNDWGDDVEAKADYDADTQLIARLNALIEDSAPSASIADTAGAKAVAVDCAVCGGTGDVSGEYPGEACHTCGGSGKVPIAAPPAPPVADAAGALPPGDTVYQAPYAGHAFRYHSDDQIVEYANARVAELRERIAELERDIELSQKLR